MQWDQYERHSRSMPYAESSYLDQDAATIEQLLRQRQQQQTFTFSNFNNMNTAVHFDHMGVYVEGSLSEVHDA